MLIDKDCEGRLEALVFLFIVRQCLDSFTVHHGMSSLHGVEVVELFATDLGYLWFLCMWFPYRCFGA
jgi:hypothetical protein